MPKIPPDGPDSPPASYPWDTVPYHVIYNNSFNMWPRKPAWGTNIPGGGMKGLEVSGVKSKNVVAWCGMNSYVPARGEYDSLMQPIESTITKPVATVAKYIVHAEAQALFFKNGYTAGVDKLLPHGNNVALSNALKDALTLLRAALECADTADLGYYPNVKLIRS